MLEIKFTGEQYKTLIKTIYLGNWIVNSIRVGKEEIVKEFDDLEQYIFSFCGHKDVDVKDLVEYADKFKRYFPTAELEMETDVRQYLEEYENEIFWDELADKLARRDIIRRHGKDVVMKMDKDKRFRELNEIADKYETELENYGIERLKIDEEMKVTKEG